MFRRSREAAANTSSGASVASGGDGSVNRSSRGGIGKLGRRISMSSAATWGGGGSVGSYGGGSFSGGSVGGGMGSKRRGGGSGSGALPRQIGVVRSNSSVSGGDATSHSSQNRRIPRHILGGVGLGTSATGIGPTISNSGSGAATGTSVRAGRRTSLDTYTSFAEHSITSTIKDDKSSSTTRPTLSRSTSYKQKGIMRYTTLAESLQTVFGSYHHYTHHNLNHNCEGTVSTSISHSSRNLYLNSELSQRSMDTHTTGSSLLSSRHQNHNQHHRHGVSQHRRRRIHHHVGFSSVEVRQYLRIVGDNPACSSGPPISIGWDYYPNVQLYDIDDYEERQLTKRRCEMELALPRHVREELLMVEWGVCSTDLVHAIHVVIRVKNQRRISIHQKNGTHTVLERTGSKLLRKLLLKRSTTKEALELQRQHLAYMDQEAKREERLRGRHHDLPEEAEATATLSQSQSHSKRVVRPTDEGFDYASYYLPADQEEEERTRYVYSPIKSSSPKRLAVISHGNGKIKMDDALSSSPIVDEQQHDLTFVPDGFRVSC